MVWLLALNAGVACGQGGAIHRAEGPGVLQQELSMLERDYCYGASRCTRTAEEVVDMQRRCSEEHWADCVYAASMYSNGCGVAEDRAQAEALSQRACGFGSVLGCTWAGVITHDVERAIALLEKPCALGQVQACGGLGVKLLARGKEADIERATELLDQACRKDTRYYCGALGDVVSAKKQEPRFEATRALLEHACKDRDLKACETLARTFEDGSLGKLDSKRAAELNATTCYALDHLPACNALARMAFLGGGGERALTMSARMFYKACNRGYAPACDNMGQSSENGWGVPASPGTALGFYDLGCRLGSDDSCQRARALRAAGVVQPVAD